MNILKKKMPVFTLPHPRTRAIGICLHACLFMHRRGSEQGSSWIPVEFHSTVWTISLGFAWWFSIPPSWYLFCYPLVPLPDNLSHLHQPHFPYCFLVANKCCLSLEHGFGYLYFCSSNIQQETTKNKRTDLSWWMEGIQSTVVEKAWRPGWLMVVPLWPRGS